MAEEQTMKKRWILLLPKDLADQLLNHLFPGDHDEHGAVLAASLVETDRGVRLLARDLFIAEDGVDYVPGKRGYRMLKANFVRDRILHCRNEHMVYLAVHCHGGRDAVAFSGTDLTSHKRGYPALLQIAKGTPVGALVFAENAVAGQIWLPDGRQVELSEARIVGRKISWMYPSAPDRPPKSDEAYDRQARLFGDRGQAILSELKVGIIGAGGAGSLISEYLSRLGVGHLIITDPDRIEPSNLSRVVGSRHWDALTWLTKHELPRWVRNLAQKLTTLKVKIAARVAASANSMGHYEAVAGSIVQYEVAQRFRDCDYIFLAADSHQARHVFNALVNQYLIPGMQVGAKVQTNPATGEVVQVFSVFRPVTPGHGCLWCNELVKSAKLQEEAMSLEERRAQQYVNDINVKSPSVITLNAVAAAHAVNDFLFAVTGLLGDTVSHAFGRFMSQRNEFKLDLPRKDPLCVQCGATANSRFGRGDNASLPTRLKHSRT